MGLPTANQEAKSISPHGSRVWEFAKTLANKFLTDPQRRAIKNSLIRVQHVPLRILGIDQMMANQKSEIERLKSRLTLVDGKFNLALYGMPKIGEFASTLISNPLVRELEKLNSLENIALKHERRIRAEKRPKDFFEKVFQSLPAQPRSLLWIGATTPMPSFKKVFPATESLTVSDSEESPEVTLRTDPISAVLSQGERKFDLVLICDRFHRLAALEQIHFIAQCSLILNPDGAFVVIGPNVAHESGYWADTKAMRPFSKELILSIASETLGDARAIGDSEADFVFICRKRH